MDEYPTHSVDHNVPLLVTFGFPSGHQEQLQLPQDLRDEAILIRSELPVLDSTHASAVHKYIQDGNASAALNTRDTTKKFRFHIRNGGRVCYWDPGTANDIPENAR